jgi:hypothetical protein
MTPEEKLDPGRKRAPARSANSCGAIVVLILVLVFVVEVRVF